MTEDQKPVRNVIGIKMTHTCWCHYCLEWVDAKLCPQCGRETTYVDLAWEPAVKAFIGDNIKYTGEKIDQ